MTAAHSKLGASSMYRWSSCPGSVRQCESLPNKSSRYAEEGSDAHALAALCIGNEFQDPHDFVDRSIDADSRKVHVDAEMADAVAVYVDYARGRAAQTDTRVFVEQRFDLSAVHPGCFGTADLVLWFPSTGTLEVIDYKHGAGIPVEVENNSQLQYYGLGALLSLNLPAKSVALTIVQPRCDHADGPIRSWDIDALDLLDFRADLKDFALATEDPKAQLVSGSHCRFCPASRSFPSCPALDVGRQAVTKMEFRPVNQPGRQTYDPEELRKALDLRETLKAWIKGLDEFAYAEAEAGKPIPGYKLVAKRATRAWSDEDGADAMLTTALAQSDDAIYEPSALKSPAAIEKLVGKKVFAHSLAQYVTAESSGSTLVPVTDKRPAISVSKIEFPAIAAPAGGAQDSVWGD